MGLLQNITQNITSSDISDLLNVSSLPEFMVKINHDVYDGWLYFVTLLVLWVILFFGYSDSSRDFLINMLYTCGFVSILSLMFRGFYVVELGVRRGLLTDNQLWAFPVLTMILIFIVWMTRER